MKTNVKKMVMMAMLSAVAFALVALIRIPVVLFLSYEPKDVVIAIGGFLFGPLMAFGVSAIASLIEFMTISGTGVIGLVMNVLSTCAFACTASYIYKKNHTMKGAWMGLIAGSLLMSAVMVLWNYLITPFYMGIPREEVVKLLLPVILPFNLLKAGLNSAILLLIYKPVVQVLRKMNLVEESHTKSSNRVGTMMIAVVLLATCVLAVLAFQGII